VAGLRRTFSSQKSCAPLAGLHNVLHQPILEELELRHVQFQVACFDFSLKCNHLRHTMFVVVCMRKFSGVAMPGA
jgi:hypothetical protein